MAASSAHDFSAFYASTYRPLCAQLYLHTGSLAESQDLVQEAFCRALAQWDRIVTYDDPAAWVRRVAWNLAVSRWRSIRRLRELAPRLVDPPTIPEPSPDRVVLAAALRRLPRRQRQSVVLHYLTDMPVADVARLIGTSEGTVKSWLHRARASLAAHLSDQQMEEIRG